MSISIQPQNELSTPKTILVVEDCPLNYQLAKYILSLSGYIVDWAANGRVAIEKALGEGHYDLVLMDVHMPEMGGVRATQIIRQFRTKADLPIIGITADNTEDQLKCLLEAGINDRLLKPYEKETLVKTIKENINSPIHPAKNNEMYKECDWYNTQWDKEFLRKAAPLFEQRTQEILNSISNALEQKNSTRLAELCHQLKGTVGNFTTLGAFKTISYCESLIAQKDYQTLTVIMPVLRRQIQELKGRILLINT